MNEAGRGEVVSHGAGAHREIAVEVSGVPCVVEAGEVGGTVAGREVVGVVVVHTEAALGHVGRAAVVHGMAQVAGRAHRECRTVVVSLSESALHLRLAVGVAGQLRHELVARGRARRKVEGRSCIHKNDHKLRKLGGQRTRMHGCPADHTIWMTPFSSPHTTSCVSQPTVVAQGRGGSGLGRGCD